MSRVISPWETSITMNVKLYGLYCLMAMATPYHALHAISALDVAHSIKDTTKHYVDHPKPRIVPAKIERLQSSENKIAISRVKQGLFAYGHHIKASKDKTTSDKNGE